MLPKKEREYKFCVLSLNLSLCANCEIFRCAQNDVRYLLNADSLNYVGSLNNVDAKE